MISIGILILIPFSLVISDFIKSEFLDNNHLSRKIEIGSNVLNQTTYSIPNSLFETNFPQFDTTCNGNKVVWCESFFGYGWSMIISDDYSIYLKKESGGNEYFYSDGPCEFEISNDDLSDPIKLIGIKREGGFYGMTYCVLGIKETKILIKSLLKDGNSRISYEEPLLKSKNNKWTINSGEICLKFFCGTTFSSELLVQFLIHHTYISSKKTKKDIRSEINFLILKERPYLFLKNKFWYSYHIIF